jgi:beta-N-acetylhexosaminidase
MLIYRKQNNSMDLRRPSILSLILLVSCYWLSGLTARSADPPFFKYMNHPWVDSVLKTLDTDQQIGQCIWVAGWSGKDIAHEVELDKIIRKYGIGGIIFFKGNAEKQAGLTNYFQGISRVPLLISMDAEWGVGMRLDEVGKFPFQMTMGAIRNDSLIFSFGNAVAEQFRRLGMHLNLAPVADINSDPGNPVINYRSFGDNRERVAEKCIMFMKGMQSRGIAATAKHFPGHGDTRVDSHTGLPSIGKTIDELDKMELYPFKRLIDEGVSCVMTAHLNLPSLDTATGLPATLSPLIIKELLIKRMGFKGLVITDAMNMKGVTGYLKEGQAEAKALEAGNDVVEFVTDVEAAVKEIKNSIVSKKLTNEDISAKCRKVLALKYWCGLNESHAVSLNNLDRDLSPGTSKALIRDLYANALTVINNSNEVIPLKNIQNIRIATIAINRKDLSLFQKRIGQYHSADNFTIDPHDSKACAEILKKLQGYDIVLAGIYGLDQRPGAGFGVYPELVDFIGKLPAVNKTIVSWFGNPYALDQIPEIEGADGLILAYQENEFTEDISAQLIFGGPGARGTLPVKINQRWPSQYGIETAGNLRMQYGFPETAAVSSGRLAAGIDSIAGAGINAGAYPGCEVMVAVKGVVVFHKCYGYQTYDNRVSVEENDLFDLASVTKIAATLPGLMLLDGEGRFSPDRTLGSYLPLFRKSNKSELVLRDMLSHQAGLTAWIPFWKETVRKNGKFRRNIFDCSQSDKFPLKVAQGMYINKNYRKEIFEEIKKSPVNDKKQVYSDLTFIIAPEIIEKLSGEHWNEYVSSRIYKKIGAENICFNPCDKYPLSRIVPTEYDSLFRKQLLHGTVHDEGAAMLGGLSGHAGLFATANDLMKLMELYRRMGEYGGEQIIRKDIMKEYTRVQFPESNNRRGLGFDKPLPGNQAKAQKDAYPARGASPGSFGHSGFTGPFVWVDPEYQLSYVFLCNRVYPTRNNNKLTEMNIRSDILQVIYDSLKK